MPYFPVVSDCYRIIKYWRTRSANLTFEQILLKVIEESFGEKLPAKCGILFLGTPIIIFTKVEALQDIYLTQNSHVTKAKEEGNLGWKYMSRM